MPNDVLALGLDRLVLFKNPGLGWREDTIKSAQDSQRKNHFAVLIAFVRAAEQIADAPDKAGELGMSFSGH